MSFGFGAGDIVKVTELAYRLWKCCSGAASEFRELTNELSSVHIILISLRDDAENPLSLLCRQGSNRQDELALIIDNLQLVLREIERLVEKYQSLGRTKKKTFDGLKFGTHELGDLRGKLITHLAAVTTFYNSLASGSLARIESLLEDFVRETRLGQREPTTIASICDAPNDPSVWESLDRELQLEGIALTEIQKYRSEIANYLKELILTDPEGLMPSDSFSNNPGGLSYLAEDLIARQKLNDAGVGVDDEDITDMETTRALFWAAGAGEVDVVRFLLRIGVKVRSSDSQGMTALHKAVLGKKLEIAELLIAEGADVHAQRQSKEGKSLSVVVDAAREGHSNILMLLLRHGASTEPVPALCGDPWDGPLQIAVRNEAYSSTRLLLNAGAGIDARSLKPTGLTALCIAASRGRLEMVRYLLKRGANPDATDDLGRCALVYCFLGTCSVSIKQSIATELVKAGSDVDTPVQGTTLLADAILKVDDTSVKFLLQNGANPNRLDETGDSMLSLSFQSVLVSGPEHQAFPIITLLLQAGGQANFRYKASGRSLLHVAAWSAKYRVVTALLKKGADPNALDIVGASPLHMAVMGNSADIVRQLLFSGANPVFRSRVSGSHYTAFDVAVEEDRTEIIELLKPVSPRSKQAKKGTGPRDEYSTFEYRYRKTFNEVSGSVYDGL